MGLTSMGVVGLSLTGDLLVKEVPSRVHPVALFGRIVGWFDREWSNPTAVGILLAVTLPLGAAFLAIGITAVSLRYNPIVGTVVAALFLFTTVSLRMLLSVATDVIDQTASDPAVARNSIISLVGRDTAQLSPAELRSAAVESVAENLADGVVAPLAAFVLGVQLSVAVGVGAAVWVKAVNTLDSMLGYRSTPVGWASARLDDVVMWIPARLTALLIALAAGSPGALWQARSDASEPSSPNSGWPMATLAAVLDVQLVKPGSYTLNGSSDMPDHAAATRGVRIVAIAGLLAFVLAGVLVWF